MTRHGVVTAELVGRRFFWRPKEKDYGKWAAYRRLRALRELGLVLSDKPLADLPAILRVTREGARIADVGLRPAPLVMSEVRHALAVVWLTEYLLGEHRGAELTTEREIRAQRYRELRERTRPVEQGRAPDALLTLSKKSGNNTTTETIAVELDISRKDRRALERMIRQYDRELVDKVWWYVIPSRVERMTKFIEEMRAERRFEIRPWRG